MKHHRVMLAALAISILTAGQVMAAQDVPATPSAPDGALDWPAWCRA